MALCPSYCKDLVFMVQYDWKAGSHSTENKNSSISAWLHKGCEHSMEGSLSLPVLGMECRPYTARQALHLKSLVQAPKDSFLNGGQAAPAQ